MDNGIQNYLLKLTGIGECMMLILMRRVGESIMIGEDVKITLLNINGCQIKLGIDAPKNVSVHREEVYDKIKNEEEENNGNK